jgi:Zn-dependent peptidase ImmA (M78 family)
MTISDVCREVSRLKKTYDETRPDRLAAEMGVIVAYEPMGKSPLSCKGFFIYQSRIRHITVNSDLPGEVRRVVLAHELGHAVMHRDTARLRGFHDFSLYDSASSLEYEANIFAAELLLDDGDVLERLNKDTFFFFAARELMVPPELLDFKFRILKGRGYQIDLPLSARSDFLKNYSESRIY